MQILNEIRERYTAILGPNLVGIYIHGSLAFGCFNPVESDIDVIAVTQKPPSIDEKTRIIESTLALNALAPKKGIEMSVVIREYCSHFVHPTPYELHFSAEHTREIAQNPRAYAQASHGLDRDLAAHFTVINRVGITLWGECAKSVFAAVPGEYYLDSLKYDIENAREEIAQNPVYVILNLCRSLAYVREGAVLSKAAGGEWGRAHVPQFAGMITAALESYKSGGHISVDMPAAQDFCDYMLREIFTPA